MIDQIIETGQALDILDHTASVVRNIAEAVTWYCRMFGCTRLYEDKAFAVLSFQNVKLTFVVASQHLPHICIRRADAEKFGALVTHRDGETILLLD